MSKWIRSSPDDIINLDNISHIWVEASIDGYFLMGEMINSGEGVVISMSYKIRSEVWNVLNEIIENGH